MAMTSEPQTLESQSRLSRREILPSLEAKEIASCV